MFPLTDGMEKKRGGGRENGEVYPEKILQIRNVEGALRLEVYSEGRRV